MLRFLTEQGSFVLSRVNVPTFTAAKWILLILISLFKYSYGWPEGTYGLPMPKTGCPHGSQIEWEVGSRTQVTKEGSHASQSNHLASIESEMASYIVQLFCMKMSYPRDGGEEDRWMPGKYCVFKKGECPANFYEGYILWDDAARYIFKDNMQNEKGVLPDGDYGHNTKIYYCCRTDGAPHVPIHAPTSAPFYLLKYGDVCQEVYDMSVTEEWVYWADETRANINDQRGVYPRVSRSGGYNAYTRLYYCYYQPKPPSSTKKILLIILYTVAGLIGGLTIFSFLVCAVKAICQHRQKSEQDDDLELPRGGARPHPIITQSPEPPMVYRYVSVSTSEDGGPTLVTSGGGPLYDRQNNQGIPLIDKVPVGLGIPSAPSLEGEQGRSGEGEVELRMGSRRACERTPSCVCERCISLPPPYSEIIEPNGHVA